MKDKSNSITRVPPAGSGLEKCFAGLTRYCFETHEVERDAQIWPLLVQVVLADERDHSRLPFAFVLQCVSAPKAWAAGMFSGRPTNAARAFVAEHAALWLEVQKPRPPEKKAKRMILLVVAAACVAEGMNEYSPRTEKTLNLVARRLGPKLKWHNVRYMLGLFYKRRASGSDEVLCGVTDKVLRRIDALMRAIEARTKLDASVQAFDARHYQPATFEAAMAATVALPKLKNE